MFITTPADFEQGQSYPAILNLHGGPQAQFGWGYAFSTQYYASRGYIVIEPNPRGSTGRGQEFLEANYRAWGVDDYDDVMAAGVKRLIKITTEEPSIGSTGIHGPAVFNRKPIRF